MVIEDDQGVYQFLREAELKPLQIAKETARRNEFNLVSVNHCFFPSDRYVLQFGIEVNEKIYGCSLTIAKAVMLNCDDEEAECWRHIYRGPVRREDRGIEEAVKYEADVIDKIATGIMCRGQFGTVRRKEVAILPGTPEWFGDILKG